MLFCTPSCQWVGDGLALRGSDLVNADRGFTIVEETKFRSRQGKTFLHSTYATCTFRVVLHSQFGSEARPIRLAAHGSDLGNDDRGFTLVDEAEVRIRWSFADVFGFRQKSKVFKTSQIFTKNNPKNT